jgi:hypothetical protein
MTGRHSSEEFHRIALGGMVLRCEVGSGVHGTAIGGTDDRDEMGVCIEPPEYVIGLRPHFPPGGEDHPDRFEQYIYRTQPEGRRSGAGDLDLTVYSLRKWMRLALEGNPTVLLLLFAPERAIVETTPAGEELRDRAAMIVSRQAGERFAGYLNAQRRALLSHGGKGSDVTRPELIEAYGWDTKYGAHMVRLGVQGVELLETGRITLPVPQPWRTWITELRTGGHTMDEALALAGQLEAKIRDLLGTSALPKQPDYAAADEWLIRTYREAWRP